MSEPSEQQIAKVVDDAVGRRDRSLPTWASARLTRLFRALDPAERQAIVERVRERPGVTPELALDIQAAADRAATPAPPPPPAPVPSAAPAARPTSPSTARRSTATRPARGTRTSTFKARTLDDVPAGTRVEYQGRGAAIEPPWLVLDDGRKFKFLNPAAAYVNGGVEVNGWDAWKVADGRSLAECFDSGNWPSTSST